MPGGCGHPHAQGPSAGLGMEFAPVPQPGLECFASSMAQPAMPYRTSHRQTQRKAPTLLQGSRRKGPTQLQTPLLPPQPGQRVSGILCCYSYHLFISERDKSKLAFKSRQFFLNRFPTADPWECSASYIPQSSSQHSQCRMTEGRQRSLDVLPAH